MNAPEMINAIGELIADRELSNTGKYYIGVYKGEYACVPTDSKPKPWPILAVVTEGDCRRGLHKGTWNHILKRLVLLTELDTKVWNHQKRLV